MFKRLGTGAVAFASVVASLALGSAPVAEGDVDDRPLVLNVASPKVSTDATGLPLTIAESSGDPGEITLTGHTSVGIPFVLIAQSAIPTEQSRPEPPVVDQDLLKQAQQAPGLVPDKTLAPYTTDGPVTFSVGYTSDELEFDAALLEPTFSFAVTPTTVSFAWALNSDVVGYIVTRDGETVGKVDGTSYAESGLKAGETYQYGIEGVTSDGAILTSRSIPIATLGKPTTRSEGAIIPMTYQPWTTAFTYETFITDAQVNLDFFATMGCGQAGIPNRAFGGDNRSWVSPNYMTPWDPPNYRTMLFANVNWDNPAPYDVILTGGIGATTLYDNGTLIETRTATFDNTHIIHTYKSGAYAQTQWQHSVGNPFCFVGAITYDNTIRFYRSGTIEISRWRYPVPNHEAYGRWDNGSGEYWDAMYQGTNAGFICLGGTLFCAAETISISESH